MRIALVTLEYSPFIIGGAGQYAHNISLGLAKLGNDITVLFPFSGDCAIPDKRDGISLIGIKIVNSHVPSSIQFSLRVGKEIGVASKNERFDYVFFNGLSYLFLNKRISKSIQVMMVHHLSSNYCLRDQIDNTGLAKYFLGNGEQNPISRIHERRALESCDILLANSNFVKESLRDYSIPMEKVHVASCGVENKNYSFPKERLRALASELNVPDENRILFVGRIDDPRKGLSDLLEALKIVKKETPCHLIIAGSGRSENMIKKCHYLGIENSVSFLGFVSEQRLRELYALSDLCVFPSHLEGFGLTIMDGIIAGKPVIATRTGSIPEVAGDCVRLVEPKNPEELSSAILDVLHDKIPSQHLEEYRKRILTRFSWQKSTEVVDSILREHHIEHKSA